MMALIEEQAETNRQQSAEMKELQEKVTQQADVIQILQKGILSSVLICYDQQYFIWNKLLRESQIKLWFQNDQIDSISPN